MLPLLFQLLLRLASSYNFYYYCNLNLVQATESSTSLISGGSPSFNKSNDEQLGSETGEDVDDVESAYFKKYAPVYAQHKVCFFKRFLTIARSII